MGYLLEGQFIKQTIVIPESDVQIMDASNAPYTLINTNNSFYCVPLLCYIQSGANQTTPYSGFTHLHLSNTGNYSVGDQCGTLAANSIPLGEIGPGYVFSMLIDCQASPNIFGSGNGFKPLQIFWDVPITAGDGDLIITLYYSKFSI